MKVADVMTSDVATCQPEEPLSHAAWLMWNHDCGCLPVVDSERRPVGVITDRDICMAAFSTGARLADLPVTHAMAPRIFSCTANESLASTHQTLRDHQIRRLLVVDDDGALIGVIGLADIVRADIGLKSAPARTAAVELLQTMAAVTRPRQDSAATPAEEPKPAAKPVERVKVLPAKAPATRKRPAKTSPTKTKAGATTKKARSSKSR